jgi:hypothetical protein
MSGDNTISLDEVMTADKYNMTKIYEAQHNGDADDLDYSPLSNGRGICEYHEPSELMQYLSVTPSFNKYKKSRSYFHLNCRGLSSNWDKFYNLVCDIHTDNFAFDCIGISEVFRCDRDQRIGLPGYHNIITRCRGENDDCRGGVALFIKETIDFKIRNDLSVFIPHVYESVVVEILPQSGKKIIVAVIYRPNTAPRADMDLFTTTLHGIIDQINMENKLGVIMGDMNVDLLKYSSHDATDTYVDGIFSRGFIPRILKPTRVTHTSATLIDHVITNDISHSSTSGIIINDVADHFAIFYISTSTLNNTKSQIKQTRLVTEQNIAIFKSHLANIDFASVMHATCPNEAYDTFFNLYKQSFNQSFPLRNFTISQKAIKREQWMTSGLVISSRNKSRLYTKKLKKPTEDNINAYKTYVKIFNKLKRRAKIIYFKTSIDENKHNTKQLWKILKQAIGKENNKSNFPHSFIVENETVSDEDAIAKGFNTFFANIGYNISHNVPQSRKPFDKYMPHHNVKSIFLDPVHPMDVINVTRKLKPKTSSGSDGVSTKLLIKTIDEIVNPITHIINISLQTGIFPNELKCAKVIPIHKSGDPSILNNYRPISLLSSFSKLLERIMYNKMMKFLTTNDILYKHQYGFRPKHSTIHPVIHLLNHCAEANNTIPSKYTLATFCDLSKAFDTISHRILLHKLNIYGIRGVANKWIESYLHNRSQFVEINSHKSPNLPIKCGVPQGSILGPLLFLIYINDISNSTNGNILSFADDTTIFLSDFDPVQLFIRANACISDIFDWFCANKLSLNTRKTNYMLIQPSKKKYDFSNLNISVNGNMLSRENCCKFLGIYIDESLSWRKHSKYINSKISRSLFAMKQAKVFLPKESLRTLYFSLINSHIVYGILAWGNAKHDILNKTHLLQKRALRAIHNKQYNSHTDPLFKQSMILKLSDLHELEVLLFMHDYANGKLPSSFEDMYLLNNEVNSAYLTRQSNLYHVARSKSKSIDILPLFNFPSTWNKWSLLLNLNTTRSCLKNTIKSVFLDRYANVVKCENVYCNDCYHVP